MQITRFIPDLANVMAAAKISVSRAGYNTVGDILRAGCTAVLVPFAGGVETEQLRRAHMMRDRGLATMLLDDGMTPQSLAAAIDEAALLEKGEIQIDLEGANTAAHLLIKEYDLYKMR
jgi:predicted glycosyltransferase